MRKNKILLILFVSFIICMRAASASSTRLYVDPSSVNKAVGDTFKIDVKIDDVTDLDAFDFKLGYDTSILDATDAAVSFLIEPTLEVKKEIDDNKGLVWVAFASLEETGSGSGTLAIITFEVKEEGESDLNLYDTMLVNSEAEKIDHETRDGVFDNIVTTTTIPPRRGRWPIMLLGLSHAEIITILIAIIVVVVIVFGAFKFFAKKK